MRRFSLRFARRCGILSVNLDVKNKGDVPMAFLLTDSAAALPAETLPALKITHFYGAPARGRVYAYMRCYVRRGTLHWCATVFDGAPPATARIALAVTPDDTASRYFFLSVGKDSPAHLSLRRRGTPDAEVETLALPAPRRVAGADEQGEYWGAEGELPAAVFRRAFGTAPKAGSLLPGNVFLYDEAERAFGAAFPCPGCEGPSADAFGTFLVVPY